MGLQDAMGGAATRIGAARTAVAATLVRCGNACHEAWKRYVARALFGFAASLILIEAIHDIAGLPSSQYAPLLDIDVIAAASVCAGLLMMIGKRRRSSESAWTILGIATILWGFGWFLYEFPDPVATLGEALVVIWYLMAMLAVAVIIRSRLRNFDIARWIDGFAFGLLAATPIVIALQLALEKSPVPALVGFESIAHPIFDLVILGMAMGAIALAGWRPPRAWSLLAAGLTVWVAADTIWSVDTVSVPSAALWYFFLWPLGIMLVAGAAWQDPTPTDVEPLHGARALYLPLACQAIAVAIQIWGLVTELGYAERIFTILVLLTASFQIYVRETRREKATTPSFAADVLPDEPEDNSKPPQPLERRLPTAHE